MQALCQLSYSPVDRELVGLGKGTSRLWGVGNGGGPVDDGSISPQALKVVVGAGRRLEQVNHDVAVVEKNPLRFGSAFVSQRLSPRFLQQFLHPAGQGLHMGTGVPGGYHEHLGDYEQISDFQQDYVLALLVGDGVCGQPGKCHCVYGYNLLASATLDPGWDILGGFRPLSLGKDP